jgi:hypothetical protein
MATTQHTGIADFYERDVLPALTQNLDHAFPEFGWQRDAHGWRATNQEFTHATLGVRADRVVCNGDAPRGFLIHGQGPVLWTTYINDRHPARGREFIDAVRNLADRAGIDADRLDRPPTTAERKTVVADPRVVRVGRRARGGRGSRALAARSARRVGRSGCPRWRRGFERRRRASRGLRPQLDGVLSGRAAGTGRRLPSRRAVRCHRSAAGSAGARQRAAAARPRLRCRRRRDRGVEPGRDSGVADADRVRHRVAHAHEPEAARVRLLASCKLGLAAATGVQPDKPLGLPRERAFLHALRCADDTPLARRVERRVGCALALLRSHRARTCGVGAAGDHTATVAARDACDPRADARRLRVQLAARHRTGLDRRRRRGRDQRPRARAAGRHPPWASCVPPSPGSCSSCWRWA